jgi:hypothetical protein
VATRAFYRRGARTAAWAPAAGLHGRAPGAATTWSRWCASSCATATCWMAWSTGLARLGGALMRRWHAQRRNTRAGSRRNIAAHYDLGNDLFRLFLDEPDVLVGDLRGGRRHWSARRHASSTHLPQAGPEARAITWSRSAPAGAASPCTPRSTTAAASPPPRSRGAARARARAHRRGRRGRRITLLLRGLPRPRGPLRQAGVDRDDRGHRRISTSTPTSRSAPPARARRARADAGHHHRGPPLRGRRCSVDFIKRYIFPGSFIPSVPRCRSGRRAHRLKLTQLEDIGPSYALTLRRWRSVSSRNCRGARAWVLRALHPHVASSTCLLRGRLPRALDRRRADAARETVQSAGRSICPT